MANATRSESNESGQNSHGADIIIPPRNLSIAWGNDSRYWRMPEKNNDGTAELLQVCWLEVTGTSQNLTVGKKYGISFKISMKPEAFGWKDCTVFMMAKIGKKGKYTWKRIKKLDEITTKPVDIPEDKFEMTVPDSATDTQLHFGLYEVWSGKSKGGLVIHHACIKEV